MQDFDILISSDQIQARVQELATDVEAHYKGEEVVLVGVLKGSLYFLADLSRNLGLEFTIDFVQLSSYGDAKSSSGVVQIRKDLDNNIEGKNVLIVEDIVDTGLTLKHLKELLSTRKPKSLAVISLLSKPEAREHEQLVDFLGFEIPNSFVVGYGLDYAERYRNLPDIAVLKG